MSIRFPALIKTLTWLSFVWLISYLAAAHGSAFQTISAAPNAITWPRLSLTQVISGTSQPVYVTHAGDNSGRLFIVEKKGTIRIWQGGLLLATPFLDIRARMPLTLTGEEGLWSVAFPPGYGITRNHFYAAYVNTASDIEVARFFVSSDANVADAVNASIVLTIPHPNSDVHHGGQLQFNPLNQYLYVSVGDGGLGTPSDNAQDPNVLLGKILRIDVQATNPLTFTDAFTYSIPASNPFTQTVGTRPEIWALGLRNPYRFSFDRANGDLYLGDVGQDLWEEVDYEPYTSTGGLNWGWDCYEGNHVYDLTGCTTGYTFPITEYNQGASPPYYGCAMVGGNVYRGQADPLLVGWYFYGDFCTGRLFGMINSGGSWQATQLLTVPTRITSFGEDQSGNLYVVGYRNGVIYALRSERHYLPMLFRDAQ